MKHIIKYKIFESSNFEKSFLKQYKLIKPELDEILLPLVDNKIKYEISVNADDFNGMVTVLIDEGDEKVIYWGKIKDDILHLVSFMKSEGIEYDASEVRQYVSYLNGDVEFHNIIFYYESDLEELEDSFKFTKFNFIFFKMGKYI
jgi:hypothetical protein